MRTLLARAEWPDPVLDAPMVARWPRGSLEALVARGVLVPMEPAPVAACEACGADHVESVCWVRDAVRPTRACITCPELGIVWLDPDDLRRWVIRLPTLARLVAGTLGASGEVAERVPGRVWRLGPVRAGGRVWIGLLAAGLTRSDAPALIETVPEFLAPNALVLVPSTIPASLLWSAPPTVIPLSDLLVPGSDRFAVDRDVLTAALPTTERSSAKGPARAFVAPLGTTWDRVELVVEEHHVRVTVGATVERFGFAEAGFEDRRERGTPDELWSLLGLLARLRGTLGTGDRIATKSGSLKQKVSRLRDQLRALLGLDSDPFYSARSGRPYRTRFAIRSAGPITFPTPPGATWDDITITEIATGIVEVSVRADVRGVARSTSDEVTRWEGITEQVDRYNRYTLADVGVEGPNERAFSQLLRAGGRLERGSSDSDVIALNSALTSFFHLGTPPLMFDAKRQLWVAAFEAASFVSRSDW